MPGVSRIVEIDGKKYLDGGIADSIPIKKAQELGYDKIIVVTTRPIDYRKKVKKNRILMRMYKNYPSFQKTIELRNQTYNETVEELIKLEKEKKIFVIRPSQYIPIKRIEKNKERIQEQYNLGVEDFEREKNALRSYLKE